MAQCFDFPECSLSRHCGSRSPSRRRPSGPHSALAPVAVLYESGFPLDASRQPGGLALASVSVDTRLVLRQVLAETDDLLAQAELDIRRLEERVRLLQAERQGLRLALARHGDGVSTSSTVASIPTGSSVGASGAGTPTPWVHLSRAEAVLETLVREGRPLARLEIVGLLADVGRTDDDADAVSAALAYLRRTGKVHRAASGQWVTSNRA